MIRKRLNQAIERFQYHWANRKYRALSKNYDFNGYKRIYNIHIRKTGGTSLNKIFLSLIYDESDSAYNTLARAPLNRIVENGTIFVGWNNRLIQHGHYFYAFSHIPYHQLNLPPSTFTITCFRDPMARVLSHYKMLMELKINNSDHPCMKREEPWLGSSFKDFLQRIPDEHLLRQLFMFSKDFRIDDALASIKNVSCVMFTEEFSDGINEISKNLGVSLKYLHTRKSSYQPEIDIKTLDQLRDRLDKEYVFLERIRADRNTRKHH